uniref:SH2B adapter protein 1-like isoform X2 n=1 Tax=Myxine glutinosa TaxID=7769 RepID=UPI00358FB5BF
MNGEPGLDGGCVELDVEHGVRNDKEKGAGVARGQKDGEEEQCAARWHDFCERHARSAAAIFAKQYLAFVASQSVDSRSSGSGCGSIEDSAQESRFSLFFAESFRRHFSSELERATAVQASNPNVAKRLGDRFADDKDFNNDNNDDDENGDDSLPYAAVHSETVPFPQSFSEEQALGLPGTGHVGVKLRAPKSHSSDDIRGGNRSGQTDAFARVRKRFSLRRLGRNVRGLFRRDSAQSASGMGLGWSRQLQRLSLVWRGGEGGGPGAGGCSDGQGEVGVRREGALRFAVAAEEGQLRWERCRLCLRLSSTLPAHYLLEIFSPPKMTKPRASVTCTSIVEARTTTPLEMPDRENTFVIKTELQEEYLFETIDGLQLRSWLVDISDCMQGRSEGEGAEFPSMPFVEGIVQRSSSSPSGSAHGESLLPPPPSDPNHPVPLSAFPWFHGPLSRPRAAQLVLAGGPDAHGSFLVRQSETRHGEYVLTFNCLAKAKHLRVAVGADGRCRVQHLWFGSALDMLQHFSHFPIPLESGPSPVSLTAFVPRMSRHVRESGEGGIEGPALTDSPPFPDAFLSTDTNSLLKN